MLDQYKAAYVVVMRSTFEYFLQGHKIFPVCARIAIDLDFAIQTDGEFVE